MPVQKPSIATRANKVWLAVPVLLALAASVLMFRGGASMYWGPLESDLTNQFYPWRVFLHRWLVRGVFAFWDPHIFSGYPTIETQQMLNLNPLHLVTMWLDPKIGLKAFTAVNTLIGCIGMAWGLRRWGRCSWMAAALGAGLYIFGALFAVRVMAGHITVVSALAWWPLAALSVLRIVRWLPAAGAQGTPAKREIGAVRAELRLIKRSARLRRLIAVSALAHAMVCLAGAPQYIVYLFYIDIAVLLAAARRWTWGASLGVLAGVWVLALMVSTPQWLPAMWYLPYTGRATMSSSMSGFSLAGMDVILLELLMPFPFGDDISRGHLHFKNVWETATYPGGVALIFGLALVLKSVWWALERMVRRRRLAAPVTPLAAAGVMIFLFGCYMMVGGWLPGFGGFREPQKARALLAFGFAVMAAGAFDGIVRRPHAWKKVLVVAVLFFCVVHGSITEYANPQEFRKLIMSFGFPMDPLAGAYYNAVLDNPNSAARQFYLAAMWSSLGVWTTVLFLLMVRRAPRKTAIMIFWVALADPFLAHAPAWLARHPWNRAGLPEAVEDYFEPKLAASEGELPWRVILHSSIINRTHHIEGFYEFHGYDPLMPAFAVGRMLVKGAKDVPDDERAEMRTELIQRVGVRYDSSGWLGNLPYDSASTATAVLEAPGATLFAVSRYVIAGSPGPNLFGPDLEGRHYVIPGEVQISEPGLVDSPDLTEDFRQMIEKMASRREADQTDDTDAGPESGLLTGESITHLETGRPDEVGVKLSLTEPALIVYKGTWLPGWRVVMDGEDIGHALFANNWMCGAIVPEGEHEVVFRYRPVAWWPSWMLSGLGLVVSAALLLWRQRRGSYSVHGVR